MFELLKSVFESQDNYKIIDNPKATEPDLAVIYFSSNGWSSPKNAATRVSDDYYEFHRNQVKRAGRHIYIRDVSLAFYLQGINPQINSIDKLLEFLQEKTKGYKKVVTLGVSSGGYLAMIAGSYLKAQYAISFSGQITLQHYMDYLKQLPSWINWQSSSDQKYFDIAELVNDGNIPVYHFEAIRCAADIPNWQTMLMLPNARVFSIDNEYHGTSINAVCTGIVVNQKQAELEKVYQQFQGGTISEWQINSALLSFKQLCAVYFKKMRKSLIKIKFSKKESLIILFGITFYNSTNNKLQK